MKHSRSHPKNGRNISALSCITLENTRPAPYAIDRLDPVFCYQNALLPLDHDGKAMVIAAPSAGHFTPHFEKLCQIFGPTRMALADEADIQHSLTASHGAAFVQHALTALPDHHSCRFWQTPAAIKTRYAVLGLLLFFMIMIPHYFLSALLLWGLFSLLLTNIMKIAAIFIKLRSVDMSYANIAPLHCPTVSVMVALYKEEHILPQLVHHLKCLTYPKDRLEILLVVEEDDALTIKTLNTISLPNRIKIIPVPFGMMKTKPRALNHALLACKGDIIGIYDAEDIPEPDQITKIVAKFQNSPANLACIQGYLDFYNARQNWISRCFTLEYTGWFRILLPAIARLGWAVPLGGTTVFLRREALEKIGAWDAFNVTEDADLGLRLARYGYRTEMMATTTYEEANCFTIPWIKQRSRWHKGYMITYFTHMRSPRRLWHQLGPWGFTGFQVFFLSTISQFLLAPLIWSLWIIAFGMDHPLFSGLSTGYARLGISILFLSDALLLIMGYVAARHSQNRVHPLWGMMLLAYAPLATCAAYKALWELFIKPFWWDKTRHGHTLYKDVPGNTPFI